MTRVAHPVPRRPLALAATGAVLSMAALLLALVDAGAAMSGWLAAFAFAAGVPLGALPVVMTMRLVPGKWTTDLDDIVEAMVMPLPLVILAGIPVLLAAPLLYPWAGGEPIDGLRGLYFSIGGFALRSALFFAAALLAAAAMLGRRGPQPAVASIGLIVYVVLFTLVSADWLMSLDMEFHSSGFGLYVLAIHAATAMAAAVLLRALAGPPLRSGTSGGLLLSFLMMWAYFAFMQYFVLWSGDRPTAAAWFARRGDGGWFAVEVLIAILSLGPAVLLVFPPIRMSRGWLGLLASLTLAARALEMAWLAIPERDSGVPVALTAATLAACGISCLGIAMLPWTGAVRHRLAGGRSPRPREAAS